MKQSLVPVIHPEYQLYQKGDRVFCTSRQVAEAFEKRHDSVLRDIRNLKCSESFRLRNFVESFITVETGNGAKRKFPVILMPRNGFMLLIGSYTSEKAITIKEAYMAQFDAMEAFIRDYILAQDEFPIFTQAIADAYEDTKPWHFKNEIDMIYRIVLGMDAKRFREIHGLQKGASIRPYLTDAQHRAIRKLQAEDIRLLYFGMDYDTRKITLAGNALTAGNTAALTI